MSKLNNLAIEQLLNQLNQSELSLREIAAHIKPSLQGANCCYSVIQNSRYADYCYMTSKHGHLPEAYTIIQQQIKALNNMPCNHHMGHSRRRKQ